MASTATKKPAKKNGGAKKPAAKPAQSRATMSTAEVQKSRHETFASGKGGGRRIPDLEPVARKAETLACYNGPKSKRVRTLQAVPSTPRVKMVSDTIGRRKPGDVLGGKSADEKTGTRLGFGSVAAAEKYAAGHTATTDVPIETRRAMAQLAQAVATKHDRTPQQTKITGRVLVSILVALASK